MANQEFSEFEWNLISSKREIDFTFMYNGNEVTGTYTEYICKRYNDFESDIELDDSSELTADDIDAIHEYIYEKLR